MALLKESDRTALRQEFDKLTNGVRLIFFTQALDCETCPVTQQLLQEITDLSDTLELKTFNFAIDREAVNQYGIARIPAIAPVRVDTATTENGELVTSEHDYGIRFYGVPSGYEFMSLLGDILDVSRGDSGLSDASKALLAEVKAPLHFQVFTTPT